MSLYSIYAGCCYNNKLYRVGSWIYIDVMSLLPVAAAADDTQSNIICRNKHPMN